MRFYDRKLSRAQLSEVSDMDSYAGDLLREGIEAGLDQSSNLSRTDSIANFSFNMVEFPLEMNEISLIQVSWQQIKALNLDLPLFASLFKWLQTSNSDMLTLWPFYRDGLSVEEKVTEHNCYLKDMSSKISTLMNLIPSQRSRAHMCALGKRHLYYNAAEPHFDVLKVGLAAVMHNYCVENPTFMDEQTRMAWMNFFDWMLDEMKRALAIERKEYIQRAMNEHEMQFLKISWNKMKVEFGPKATGIILCSGAITRYASYMKSLNRISPSTGTNPIDETQLTDMAIDLVEVIDSLMDKIPDQSHQLTDSLKPFIMKYSLKGVLPYYAKKAARLAVKSMLKMAFGSKRVPEEMVRSWCKLFEIFVQTSIACMVVPEGDELDADIEQPD